MVTKDEEGDSMSDGCKRLVDEVINPYIETGSIRGKGANRL